MLIFYKRIFLISFFLFLWVIRAAEIASFVLRAKFIFLSALCVPEMAHLIIVKLLCWKRRSRFFSLYTYMMLIIINNKHDECFYLFRVGEREEFSEQPQLSYSNDDVVEKKLNCRTHSLCISYFSSTTTTDSCFHFSTYHYYLLLFFISLLSRAK
jgi:hypothetical protein